MAANAAAAGNYTIDYQDALKRLAVIRRQNGTEERWEYLYDCWRNIARPQEGGPLQDRK